MKVPTVPTYTIPTVQLNDKTKHQIKKVKLLFFFYIKGN